LSSGTGTMRLDRSTRVGGVVPRIHCCHHKGCRRRCCDY
jgi:hypothetical protein